MEQAIDTLTSHLRCNGKEDGREQYTGRERDKE